MPAAPLSRARMQEAVDAVDRAPSQVDAAKILGIPYPTLCSRLRRAKQAGITPAPKDEPPIVEVPASKPRVRVKAGTPEGSVYRVLLIGDAHDDPETEKDRFRWMGRHAAEMGADWVVQIGDMLTLDSLNAHIPNDTLQAKTKNPFYHDLESGGEALGAFNRGLGSHRCQRHVTLGNHERRAWFYEDANPETAGLLTGPLLSLFDQHGWSHTEYGEWWFLGGVGFIHAPLNKLGKTMGGETRQNILNKMVFDVVRGHEHQKYCYSQAKFGPLGHVTLLGAGCALPHGRIESYARHSLNGWDWGVHELTIQGGKITGHAWIGMDELGRRYG
jgi:hypothetical protein